MAQILAFPQHQHQNYWQTPLDRLLELGQITPQQHWCGMYLRELHSITLPGMRESEWLEKRHEDFRLALEVMNKHCCARETLLFCVSNVQPADLQTVVAGLSALESLWHSRIPAV